MKMLPRALDSDSAPAVEEARRTVYLHPGQVHVAVAPTTITTVLGSCVAVCLWDQDLRIGGMNHFLLPFWAAAQPSTAKYGNVAIRMLVDSMLAAGSAQAHLRAKVFGGACVLESFRKGGDTHLGLQNARLAFDQLSAAGVPVVAEDVGGDCGRRISFTTDAGSVDVRTLKGKR